MPPPRPIDRVRRAYVAAALLLLNCVVIFVLLNLAIAAARTVWHRLHHDELGPEVRRSHGLDHVAKAYEGWKRGDLVAFLRESNGANAWQYEPFTVFRPVPTRGRFVNVTAAGYRLGGWPAPWPPSSSNYNIFLFGGSTAFGVGLPDAQTIPSALQRNLPNFCGQPVAVYNFGRPAYYSIQEGVLFQRLLREGARPDLAIFLDGLNDFGYGEPAMTPALTRMVDEATRGGMLQRAADLAVTLPIAKLVNRRAGQEAGEYSIESLLPPRKVIDRWLQNRKMLQAIGQQAGTQTLFAWQPVPHYHYDLQYHLFNEPGAFSGWGTAEGYALLDRTRDAGILWLADLQKDRRENLYVDRFHYTAKFSADIANAVAAAIRERTPCPSP
jgi:hypothetical protein